MRARAFTCSITEGKFAGWPDNLGMEGVACMRTAEVVNDLDYAIVIGASIAPEELRMLRERGVGIVGLRGGNGAVISIEAMISKPPRPMPSAISTSASTTRCG